MEKVLACRRDRNLYFSALRQKKHYRQADHIKAVYEEKIIKLLNLDVHIGAIVGLATKLQLIVNKQYRNAFTKIQSQFMKQNANDQNKGWCKESNSLEIRQHPQKSIQVGLYSMRYTIETNQKNKKLKGWVAIRRATEKQQKICKSVLLLDKVVRMRIGSYFGHFKVNLNQSQSLDFFDISAIEPKGTNKDSFQFGNEEMNTEESSLRITNKMQISPNEASEIDKVESDLVNLKNKLKKKQAKNNDISKVLQDQNRSHSRTIQQLRKKLNSIKQQQKQEEQKKKMKPAHNESKMMVLGKYMGLCLELQEKISLSVEILQEIFQSQRHWDIHPQLGKFLRPYLQKIKQQNNIGQNCDIL